MQPALDYNELISSLTERYKRDYEDEALKHTRMVGLVFARPVSQLANSEIIPHINHLHYRSGEHIDFFFAGYTYPHPPVNGYVEVPIPGADTWLYSDERFNAFLLDIENRTTWGMAARTNFC